jgi:predicted PurR-regulated permease PerM
VVLAIAVTYWIRSTLVVFALALLFAYLLTPVVKVVQRYMPAKVPRSLAPPLVFLALVGIVVGGLITIGASIGEEAASLATRLPQLVQQNQDWRTQIPLPHFLEPYRDKAFNYASQELAERGRDVLPYLQQLGARVVSGAFYLGYLVLIPILSFFFLKDGPGLRTALLNQFATGPRQTMFASILDDIDKLLGQYMRALVLQALSAFMLYAVFLTLTGAPYALLMAGIAGPLEFIPVVGPLSAALVTALVTGLAGYQHLLWFLLFAVLLRGFQDYVLIPFLLGAGIQMDPLLVLFGVLAGEQIGGVGGMFFSVPVIAILRVIVLHVRRIL